MLLQRAYARHAALNYWAYREELARFRHAAAFIIDISCFSRRGTISRPTTARFLFTTRPPAMPPSRRRRRAHGAFAKDSATRWRASSRRLIFIFLSEYRPARRSELPFASSAAPTRCRAWPVSLHRAGRCRAHGSGAAPPPCRRASSLPLMRYMNKYQVTYARAVPAKAVGSAPRFSKCRLIEAFNRFRRRAYCFAPRADDMGSPPRPCHFRRIIFGLVITRKAKFVSASSLPHFTGRQRCQAILPR